MMLKQKQNISQVIVKHNGKRISIPVKRTGVFSKGYGLMFRGRNASNLVFDFTKDTDIPFTSLFVFFPYLSIWLDSKNNVMDYRIVKPFCITVKTKKKFRRVVEVPVNERNSEILEFFRRGHKKV